MRNWEFQQPLAVGFGGEVNPLKLLRRRSSLVVDDLPALGRKGRRAVTASGDRETTPLTTAVPAFEEPDAASLLDTFGL